MIRRIACVIALVGSAWKAVLAADIPTRMEWKVDGTAREALIYAPQRPRPTPARSYSPSTATAAT